MTGESEILKGKQGAFLAALLAAPTVAEAAQASNVSERTAWRYLSDPAFQIEYRAARREVTQHTIMRLQSDSTHAAKVLRDIADDTTAPASARVTACRVIIEQAFKGAEMRDLAEDVEEIKRMLGERAKGRGV